MLFRANFRYFKMGKNALVVMVRISNHDVTLREPQGDIIKGRFCPNLVFMSWVGSFHTNGLEKIHDLEVADQVSDIIAVFWGL